MRKLLPFIALVVFTHAHADSSALGKNLLKNPAFEDDLIDWRVQLGGRWSGNLGVADSGALIMEAEIPPEDNYIHETTVSQCVILPPGEKFQLKAKFKAEFVLSGEYAEKAKFANRVNVIWYESKDCSTGGQFGGWIEAKNIAGWQNLVQQHLIPAFGAKAAKIVVMQNGRYSRGYKAYWDDIAFYVSEIFNQSQKAAPLSDPESTLPLYENYVKNPSFDRDLSSWHIYKTKWSSEGATEPGSAIVSFDSDKDGYGTGAMSQCINIGENVKFDFGASVKKDETSTQSGGARIRVSWHNQVNCVGRSKTDLKWDDLPKKDIDGWQSLSIKNLAPPQYTRSVLIEIIQSVAGPGRFSLYWDDVYFKAVD